MDIKTGDEVRVTEGGGRRGSSPPGGWAGRVTRTGRKYAAAEYEVTWVGHSGRPERSTRTIEFSMETGIERNSVSNFAGHVRTPGQVAEQARRDAARDTLFKAGISVNGLFERLSVEQWEALAAVAATFPEYDRSR